MKGYVVALGRQFGSGGRELGGRLAELLGIPCYDRELISLAAKRAQIREEVFAGKDERAGNPWLFTGVYEGGPQVRRGQSAEDILFQMQSQVIVDLAKQGPCIIVGRCGNYVLRKAGLPVHSIFICAPVSWRAARRAQLEQIEEKQALEKIRRMDKQRQKYYNTYTGEAWGLPETYDLCLNSSVLGVEGSAKALARHLEFFEGDS